MKFSIGNWRNTIQTFDTDCGKIGIVICYDVEFELSRLMADEGMNIYLSLS
jgi:predicted amidohydrolase